MELKTGKKKSAEEVLDSYINELSKLKQIHFKKDDQIENIPKIEVVVHIIDKIYYAALKGDWGIQITDDQVSIYNGTYWEIVEKEILKRFLGKAVVALGYDLIKGRHHLFVQDLRNQFMGLSFNILPLKNNQVTLVNLSNGTLEIFENGDYYFRDFDKRDNLFYQLDFEFDPSAKTELFNKYLERVLPDEKDRLILAEYCGYVFTKNSVLKLEKVLILLGNGNNGKSLFYELLYSILGKHNISTYGMAALTNENGYYRSQIQHKLLNYSSELGVKLDSTMFKILSSGESTSARSPYGKPFIIENYCRFMFNANELPHDFENNNAFFRRFIILNFDQTITEEEKDVELASKIIATEKPGIFIFILNGLRRIVTNKKFTYSSKSEKILNEYKEQSDPIQLMMNELHYVPGVEHTIPLKESYEYFKNYCQESGFKIISIIKFSDRLKKLGFEIVRKTQGNIIYFSKVEKVDT